MLRLLYSLKTWSELSLMRNPVHLRLWGFSFSVLGDVANWDSGETQNPSSIGLYTDPKSEFSGTESPDTSPKGRPLYLGTQGQKIVVLNKLYRLS